MQTNFFAVVWERSQYPDKYLVFDKQSGTHIFQEEPVAPFTTKSWAEYRAKMFAPKKGAVKIVEYRVTPNQEG